MNQFDVTGCVVAFDDLDNYDKNGRAGKKKPLTLIDSEGTELRCTLWGVYAQQFSDFLNNCSDHGKIIVVLQLAMTKIWDEKCASKMDFMEQNCFCLTGTQQSMPMNFLKLRLLGKELDERRFHHKIPVENIAELLDVEQGVPSIIGGSICAIQEEEGWWYLGCRSCRKKVVKSSDIVDLESDTKPNPSAGANERWCSKCKATVTSIKTQFHMQVRVQDETGTVSVSLFNDEVQAILNNITAYQLVEKYGKGDGAFSAYIMEMVDKKFVLKVSIDGKNKEKVMPVFNVLRLSNDPDIIKSVCAAAIPGKPENEATSSKVVDVAPFNGNVNGEQSPTGTTSQEKRKVDGVDKPVLAYHEENSSTKKTKFVLDKEIKVEKPSLELIWYLEYLLLGIMHHLLVLEQCYLVFQACVKRGRRMLRKSLQLTKGEENSATKESLCINSEVNRNCEELRMAAAGRKARLHSAVIACLPINIDIVNTGILFEKKKGATTGTK
ncbi:nucleic acid-binding, OB-fold protein [Artemisia annua]|uniref:Nucleic acid-binding, OB-fold protein n=1 Tax=Artemisia annua TaxID=35608 RepID=A0A2U1KLL6_ARTAN|nr:nucleic acid-binding, OB-fold protein [Artemisia annua]